MWNILLKLLQAAVLMCREKKARVGIIYPSMRSADHPHQSREAPSITVMWAARCAAGAAMKILEHREQRAANGGDRKLPQQQGVHPDRYHQHLFICGGAFDGLDKYILRRTDRSALGFGSSLKDNSTALLRKVEPHDLNPGFGPITGDRPSAGHHCAGRSGRGTHWCVCSRPHNSLVKRYKELLSMDSVRLEFTDGATSRDRPPDRERRLVPAVCAA